MYIDLLALLTVIVFAIFGYLQGFLRQLVSILMWISVILFAEPLANLLRTQSSFTWFHKAPPLVLWGLSALGLFACFQGLLALTLYFRKIPFAETTDKTLGLALGLSKGILIVVLVGTFFATLPEAHRKKFASLDQDSRKSLFLRGSNQVFEWNSLGLFARLKEVSKELTPTAPSEAIEEWRTKNLPHPWDLESSIDRE